MSEYRQVKVAPYALLDTIKALESCDVRELVVSKEDNDLIIRWDKDNEIPLPKSNKKINKLQSKLNAISRLINADVVGIGEYIFMSAQIKQILNRSDSNEK